MTTLTLDVPADVYQRIITLAYQQRKPVEVLANELLALHSANLSQSTPERNQVLSTLRQAGILVDALPHQSGGYLTTEERATLAAQIPDRALLSMIILEDRGEP